MVLTRIIYELVVRGHAGLAGAAGPRSQVWLPVAQNSTVGVRLIQTCVLGGFLSYKQGFSCKRDQRDGTPMSWRILRNRESDARFLSGFHPSR